MNEQTINRFSFRRMMMVLGYYRAPIRKQLTIFIVIELAMFIVSALDFHPNLTFFQDGLSGLVITYLWWLGPLAFAAEGSRELAAMLPARGNEKFCAIMVYCFIIVPVVICAVWMLPRLVWSDVPAIWKLLSPGEASSVMILMQYASAFAVAQLFVPFVTVLWVVLASKKSSALRGVLAAFGAQVSLGICGIIVGLAAVYVMMKTNIQMFEAMKDAQTMGDVLDVMNAGSGGLVYVGMIAIWAVVMCYLAFALWRSYRLVGYKQY